MAAGSPQSGSRHSDPPYSEALAQFERKHADAFAQLERSHAERMARLERCSHSVERCLSAEIQTCERERAASGSSQLAHAEAMSELASARATAQQLRLTLEGKSREIELLTAQLQASILQGIERQKASGPRGRATPPAQ